jgi:hypothetical protein
VAAGKAQTYWPRWEGARLLGFQQASWPDISELLYNSPIVSPTNKTSLQYPSEPEVIR